jgi:hypothetical protein
MAIYGTLANKVMASRSDSKESFSNLDSDNGGSEGFSIYDAAFKLNIMEVCISGALDAYTKV